MGTCRCAYLGGTDHVGIQNIKPLGSDISRWFVVAVDARDIDQCIDSAVLVERRVHELLDGCVVAYVDRNEHGPDLVSRTTSAGFLDVAQYDFCGVVRECLRNLGTDNRRGPGYENSFAFEQDRLPSTRPSAGSSLGWEYHPTNPSRRTRITVRVSRGRLAVA